MERERIREVFPGFARWVRQQRQRVKAEWCGAADQQVALRLEAKFSAYFY
jgi:hypothetical protein